MSKKILIPLAEGCEELEAVTLIDLLRRANFNVITASLTDEKEVVCSRGTHLIADQTLDSVREEEFDLIVLPGGLPGADYLNADPRIHELLEKSYQQGHYVGAICAAPKVLVNSNLNLKKLTAYPGTLSDLGDDKLNSLELNDEKVVQDGKVITSRGPGTAMDFALELIQLLADKETRAAVEGPLLRA